MTTEFGSARSPRARSASRTPSYQKEPSLLFEVRYLPFAGMEEAIARKRPFGWKVLVAKKSLEGFYWQFLDLFSGETTFSITTLSIETLIKIPSVKYDLLSVTIKLFCCVSLCWMSLCWVSLCWMLWRLFRSSHFLDFMFWAKSFYLLLLLLSL